MFNKKKKHFFNFDTIKNKENEEEYINEIDDIPFTLPDIPEEKIKESSNENSKDIDLKQDLQKTDDNHWLINETLQKENDESTLKDESESLLKVTKKANFDINISLFKKRFKDYMSTFFDNINTKLKEKWFNIDKKLIAFHLNESLKAIILLFIAFIGLFQAFSTYDAIDKLPLIKKHYILKKEIKIEDEKIKENKRAEYLADILRFWVKTENWRYPQWGYLNAFKTIFPDNIWELQLLTFLEWWWSEFKDYKWRIIRVDHWLIKTFEQDNNIDDNWYLKWYKYHIVLEGEPDKVENVLYNLKYRNKIPKYFSSIEKKYSSKNKLLNVDLKVLFYLSK